MTASVEALIDRHAVISFDVFDTLLARRLSRPVDVFRHIEQAHGIADFAASREKAEWLARRRFGTADSPEVLLVEIYDVLRELLPGLPVGPQDELAAERLFLYRDPAVVALVEHARARGKRIIAISDMYLTGVEIGALLAANGIAVDRIYASADHRDPALGKFNRRIYPFVAREENVAPGDILHFGDNPVSDVRHALECGVTAVHVRSRTECVREAGAPFCDLNRREGSLADSLVDGQIAARMPHLAPGVPDLYLFGYAAAGPLLLGFCRYIAEMAARDGVERLTLLARDGYIVAKALDILELDVPPYAVMPFSRRLVVFPLLKDDPALVDRVIFDGLPGEATPRAFWTWLGLDAAAIAGHPLLDSPMSMTAFKAHFHEPLATAAAAERTLLTDYLDGWVGPDPAKTAIVDVGWGLTSFRALDRLVSPDFKAYFVGIQSGGYHRKGLSGYLFDRGEPASVEQILTSALEILELVFSDTRPAFTGLRRIDGTIAPAQEENSAGDTMRGLAVATVEAGALDFLRDIRDRAMLPRADELRTMLRDSLSQLAAAPTLREFAALADIPHAPGVGHSQWATIGSFWSRSVPVEALALRRGGQLTLTGGESSQTTLRATVMVRAYEAIAPSHLRRLAVRPDLDKLDWRNEMRAHPLKIGHWLALRRYQRRKAK
ncbi:hypothetical protein MWN34_03985 [Ancylobacter sp. 6x-1]|uniref:HAD family hydrolase n=1 Tax=Ancylobacter crimeensis TaxID=2579147 RepID=A0ABT0D8F3_9HYPH|nr:HAD family hydrolase [Ancylobacter crimeensis]MCK0196067.1 hypothetical protein [Ancylobacter crimeensis]